MAQENNGCLIFLGIIAGLAAIGAVVVFLGYAGLTMVIGIDFVARSFTWLGIKGPIGCWLALGLLTGAFIGLAMGLKRAQRSPGIPVYGGAALLTIVIGLGSYFANPAPVTDDSQTGSGSVVPRDSPSMYIDKIGGRIDSLRFFESGYDVQPFGKRAYATGFARTKTRYVNWEITCSFAARQRQVDFVINEYWYRSDGSLYVKQDREFHVPAGWSSSYHHNRKGSRKAGNWRPDTYRVELFVEGKKVASGQFQVY